MSSEGKPGFSLAGLVVVVGVLFLLVLALVPYISNMANRGLATAVRGKDIYIAIIQANTEREPLGLPSVWPRTPIGGARSLEDVNVNWAPDIVQMEFLNSTDYFNELLDGGNFGTTNWAPYVNGFDDYSRFAGAGVPVGNERKKLQSKNNMWSIAGDIEDDTPDILPILVTRNVDCEAFYKMLQGDGTEKIEWWSKHYQTPYSNKVFVMVRKGGATVTMGSRYVNISSLYPFSASPPPDVVEGLLLPYLTPDSLVVPPQRFSTLMGGGTDDADEN